MDEEKTLPAHYTGCCGALPFLASVWLSTATGRKELGDVVCCSKCSRPCGTLRIAPGAPSEFTAEVWREIKKKYPRGPFYCEFLHGVLVPYGGKKPLYDQVQVGQSFAAQSAEGMDQLEGQE